MTQEDQNGPAPSAQGQTGGFENLGLGPISLEAIRRKGFEQPTRIQAEVIPLLVEGAHDVIAQSHTGTGKTAAFGLPLLELMQPRSGHIQAIILAPTRELALQVSEELNSLKGERNFHIVPIYGGQSYELQFRHLRQGVDILVGTPGRIIDHLQRGSIDLSKISHLVLDEADEMLDMGFVDDIEAVLGTCNPDKRMLLFSATMPPRIRQIADTWMRDLREVKVKGQALTSSLTTQQFMEMLDEDRFEALCRIIDHAPEFYGMVFCRTKVESDRVYTRLLERGYTAEVLHGDVSQAMREKVLDSFRRRLSEIMVATDVAARGIDVTGLTHVINYDLPQDPESYVHRIGRTGRAGKEGIAITFIHPREFRKLQFIARHARGEIRKEKLPRIDEILEARKTRLLQEIADLRESPADSDRYLDLADRLLQAAPGEPAPDPRRVLAALLTHQLKDRMDPSRYPEIHEPDFRQDKPRRNGPRPEGWKDNHGGHRPWKQGPRPRGEEGGENKPWGDRDSRPRHPGPRKHGPHQGWQPHGGGYGRPDRPRKP